MIEPDGFLARFQAFEYALAFRVGRASLANYSITSGVSIYRRDALESALPRLGYAAFSSMITPSSSTSMGSGTATGPPVFGTKPRGSSGVW